MIRALLRALITSQDHRSWPADELWTLTFVAPAGGRLEPVTVHGLNRQEAEATFQNWRNHVNGRVCFTFPDDAELDERSRAAFLAGWGYTQITFMRIMPMREAL